MDYRLINADNGTKIISIEDDNILIENEQSVLDIFMPIVYETGEARFIISKNNLPENFFNLSNKTAGNILQKVTTYRMKLAIVGDFSGYSSKALKAFIYESNNGNDIFFVDDRASAISVLSKK